MSYLIEFDDVFAFVPPQYERDLYIRYNGNQGLLSLHDMWLIWATSFARYTGEANGNATQSLLTPGPLFPFFEAHELDIIYLEGREGFPTNTATWKHYSESEQDIISNTMIDLYEKWKAFFTEAKELQKTLALYLSETASTEDVIAVYNEYMYSTTYQLWYGNPVVEPGAIFSQLLEVCSAQPEFYIKYRAFFELIYGDKLNGMIALILLCRPKYDSRTSDMSGPFDADGACRGGCLSWIAHYGELICPTCGTPKDNIDEEDYYYYET